MSIIDLLEIFFEKYLLKNAIQDTLMEVPNMVIQVPNALIQVPGCSNTGPWMCRYVDAPPT